MTEQQSQTELGGSSTPRARHDVHSKVGAGKCSQPSTTACNAMQHTPGSNACLNIVSHLANTSAGSSHVRVQHLKQQPHASQPGAAQPGSQAQSSVRVHQGINRHGSTVCHRPGLPCCPQGRRAVVQTGQYSLAGHCPAGRGNVSGWQPSLPICVFVRVCGPSWRVTGVLVLQLVVSA